MKRWLVAHHMTFNGDSDTPHSNRAWVAIGVFLWLHVRLSTENALVDLCGLGVPLQ